MNSEAGAVSLMVGMTVRLTGKPDNRDEDECVNKGEITKRAQRKKHRRSESMLLLARCFKRISS